MYTDKFMSVFTHTFILLSLGPNYQSWWKDLEIEGLLGRETEPFKDPFEI